MRLLFRVSIDKRSFSFSVSLPSLTELCGTGTSPLCQNFVEQERRRCFILLYLTGNQVVRVFFPCDLFINDLND